MKNRFYIFILALLFSVVPAVVGAQSGATVIDEFDSNANKWVVRDQEDLTAEITDGKYVIEMIDGGNYRHRYMSWDWFSWVSVPESNDLYMEDGIFEIQVDVSNLSTSSGVGICATISMGVAEPGVSDYAANPTVWFCDTGLISFWAEGLITGGEVTRNPDMEIDSDQTARIGLRITDTEYIVFFNGEIVYNVPNVMGARPGHLGLGLIVQAGTEPANGIVTYDNLLVTPLSSQTVRENAIGIESKESVEELVTNFVHLQNVAPTWYDDFRLPSDRWYLWDYENGSAAYENDMYALQTSRQFRTFWEVAEAVATDFVIEADIYYLSPSNTSAGLLFRYVDDDNFYIFEVSMESEYRLRKREEGEWITLIEWQEWSAPLADREKAIRLGIVAYKNSIALTIDGQLVDEAVDDAFAYGDIGFAVGNLGIRRAHAAFDNLKFWELVPVPIQLAADESIEDVSDEALNQAVEEISGLNIFRPAGDKVTLEILNEVIARYPDAAPAYTARAFITLLAGNIEQAEEDAEIAVELEPDFVLAHNALAVVRLEQSDIVGALSATDSAMRLNPNDSYTHILQGLIYQMGLKDYASSIEISTKAIELALEEDNLMNAGLAYNLRGLARANMQRYTLAVSDFTKAISFQPLNAEFYKNRGRVYLEAIDSGMDQSYWEPLDDFSRSLFLQPGDAWIHLSKGNAYTNVKHYNYALSDLNAAFRLDNADGEVEFTSIYFYRALAMDDQNNFRPAFDDYKRFLEVEAEDNQFTRYACQRMNRLDSTVSGGSIASLLTRACTRFGR